MGTFLKAQTSMPDDDKHNTSQDEEFHYSELDIEQEQGNKANKNPYATQDAITQSSLKKRLFSKKVITISLLVIVVLVIYFFTRPTIEREQQSSSSSATSPSLKQSASLNQARLADNSKQQSAWLQSDQLLRQQIDQVAQENSNDEARLDQLQRQLLNTNRRLAATEQSMNHLIATIDQLSNQVAAVRKAQAHQPARKASTAVKRPLLVYHLKAIVPGRAWLQTSNGQLTTVKLGDSLRDYGRITDIEVAQGEVKTSSGRMIHYGPNDS